MQKAALPAAAIGVAIVAFGKHALDSASDLQQAQGAVESVFGKQAGAVERLSKSSADSMGLAQSAYLQYAAVVGSALQNAGFTSKQAVEESNKVMQRGADMAATFGGTTADAVEAINAAVARGEFDPLEKYGVSLNMTAVNAELAARGQDKLTGSALKHAKAQVVLDMVYKNTAKSAGQFARESDTAAGSAAIASANFEDASAALGQALLPAAAAAAGALASVARWASKNVPLVTALAAGVMTLVTAILIYNAAMKIATIVQTAFNVAVSANVVFLIIVGIIALIAAIILLIKNWDKVKAVALAVWSAIRSAVGSAVNWLKGKFAGLISAFVSGFNKVKALAGVVARFFKSVWQTAVQAVMAYFRVYKVLAQTIFSAIRTIVKNAGDVFKDVFRAVKDVVQNVFSTIRDIVRNSADVMKTVIRSVKDVVVAVFGAIRDFIRNAIQAARDAVRSAMDSAKDIIRGVREVLANLVPPGLGSMLASPFNAARGAINGAINAIKSLISWVSSLINKIAGIHWPSPPKGLTSILGKLNPFSAVAPAATPRTFYAPAGPGLTRGVGASVPVGVSGGAGVQINIFGALDPESVARQVKRLLADHDRRVGVSITPQASA